MEFMRILIPFANITTTKNVSKYLTHLYEIIVIQTVIKNNDNKWFEKHFSWILKQPKNIQLDFIPVK